jgi:hypothetical protein
MSDLLIPLAQLPGPLPAGAPQVRNPQRIIVETRDKPGYVCRSCDNWCSYGGRFAAAELEATTARERTIQTTAQT